MCMRSCALCMFYSIEFILEHQPQSVTKPVEAYQQSLGQFIAHTFSSSGDNYRYFT